MMKLWNKIFKAEEGFALPLTLIVVVIGVAFVIPVLALTTTSLNFNRTIKENTREFYSADAGIEKAIWDINEALSGGFPESVLPPEVGDTITLPDLPAELLDVNGMSQVTTTVTNKGGRVFQITATATNAADGHQTVVDCYIYLFSLSALAEGAITSNGTIKINSSVVNGAVYYDSDDEPIFNNNEDPEGNPLPDDYPIRKKQYYWPSVAELRNFYYEEDMPLFPSDVLNVEDYAVSGLPSYYVDGILCPGGTLNIENYDPNTPTLRLDGTLCIDGSIDFPKGGGRYPFNLNLNGHTIFVRDEIRCSPGILRICGNGAIISGGDLNLLPSFVSDPDNPDDPVYIFIMSVEGVAWVHPEQQAGEVWGCVLGGEAVDVLNSNILFVDPEPYEELFPDDRPMILTYETK